MPPPSQVILRALGLNLSPNQLSVPEGSMVEASNVVIRRDDVVQPRRGFKIYGNEFGISTDVLKVISDYKDRLIRHYQSTLQFDDGSGEFTSFTGTLVEAKAGLRTKFSEMNGNLYMTSADGIKKISVASASDLSSTTAITNSGIPKALDTLARIQVISGSQDDLLPQDSTVAYRVVWGTKDASENLLLGAPSARSVVSNPMTPLIAGDLNKLLATLDVVGTAATGTLSDTDYLSSIGEATPALTYNSSASDIRTKLISLTSKIDSDIFAALPTITGITWASGIATVTFTANHGLSVGDKLEITSANPSTFNGKFEITAVPSTITISFALANNPGTYNGSAQSKQIKYSYLTEPVEQTDPATHNQLVSLQEYLLDILEMLQEVPSSTSITISSNTAANPTVVTTTTNHGLRNGQTIIISGSNSTPVINGTYVVSNVTDTTFTVPVNVTVAGTAGSFVEQPEIATNEQTLYVTPLAITTTAKVFLEITVPEGITDEYFYQIYRTAIFPAEGDGSLDLVTAGDEMRLVYEAYPSSATAGTVDIVEDIVTDEFRQFNTNLYTNEATGDGILQANDPPPFAKDINIFKNVLFYANTRTRHKLFPFQLLGVQSIIADYDPSDLPRITISDGTDTATFKFRLGEQEVTTVKFVTIPANGEYFTLNGANDYDKYYVWYDVDGSGVDPAVAGRTAIKVRIDTLDTMDKVALKTQAILLGYETDFHITRVTDTLTITNTFEGYATDADDGTLNAKVTITVTTQGVGENVANKEILLSNVDSPAQAIDETARSFTRIVNRQTSSTPVYFYYVSSDTTAPGQINVEARSIDDTNFYIVANSDVVGESFSPDISPTNDITSNSLANPTVITSTAHGLSTGDQVVISGSNSTPSIDGVFTVTVLTVNTFSIPVNVTVAGTQGAFVNVDDAVVSDNETKGNRVYFSKIQQPEAVPLVNFIDVGPQDEEILRIVPLRDSLFVFKSRGTYRISGETSPFVLALFDGSTNLLAPDSIGIIDNQIFGWFDQGIQTVTESGVELKSRPIDTEILPRASTEYPDFSTATWGVGYHEDNAYYVFTVNQKTDELANICFRYDTLSETWTTYDKAANCGFIGRDGKMYLGPIDVNFMEQERKTFTRLDFADREIDDTINSGVLVGNVLQLPSVAGLEIGDVLLQTQVLTVYTYNRLLEKLDIDPSSVLSTNYLSTLQISAGANLRDAIEALADKLDTDLGGTTYADAVASISGTASAAAGSQTVFTDASHGLKVGRFITISGHSESSVNGTHEVVAVTVNTFTIDVASTVADPSVNYATNDNTFDDIGGCFNIIVGLLNVDTQVDFSNYAEIENDTEFELVILDINVTTKKITLSDAVDLVIGAITFFKSYECSVGYSRVTFNDPLRLKHVSEATAMLESKAFTLATLGFSSDLYPSLEEVEFEGDGSGIFGSNTFGASQFGGASNGAPLRTIIPRNHQRCRYINVRFEHSVAREGFFLLGITLSGTVGPSIRAYR